MPKTNPATSSTIMLARIRPLAAGKGVSGTAASECCDDFPLTSQGHRNRDSNTEAEVAEP